jgi:P27 family predicted phage terminase small subunit
MGRRGPKPAPAAVKAAKGNPGRRPIGADPVPAESSTATADQPTAKVAAPAWLNGEARTVWERLAPRLIAMKLLTPPDAYTFARYCKNFAMWLKMQRRLTRKGEIYEIETASGKVRRADPAFLMADRLDRRLEAVEDRFGLNPAERQRIFAARAAQPHAGDLFGERPIAPAAAPQGSGPSRQVGGSPIGTLN